MLKRSVSKSGFQHLVPEIAVFGNDFTVFIQHRRRTAGTGAGTDLEKYCRKICHVGKCQLPVDQRLGIISGRITACLNGGIEFFCGIKGADDFVSISQMSGKKSHPLLKFPAVSMNIPGAGEEFFQMRFDLFRFSFGFADIDLFILTAIGDKFRSPEAPTCPALSAEPPGRVTP